ncbi:MAG: BamA/TamA family outer membrane protein [Candidatus Cloacimonetes bacterium]|nr:BamA/TamA family outer membrane protein [Candidatus Cloacimonadota bacterium]
MKKPLSILLFLALFIQLSAYSFGKNKVQSSKLNWEKIETLHFDIYYPENNKEFGKLATLVAEEAYYHIKEDFKQPIMNRIPIIMYKSRDDFEATNVISNILGEGIGGFTETAHNKVVVPFDGDYKKMEKILTHELTHAYVNELNNRRSRIIALNILPFWFQEGLPEFEAVHGNSVYNNMFIIDLLLNDRIGNLSMIGGYYAYRLGESFLIFIEDEYGRNKVIELFYAIRYNKNSNAAFKKIFGEDFDAIQLKWKNYLKRKYYPDFAEYEIPYEIFTRNTDHTEDGSSLNYAPRFSPNGTDYIYFSNKNLKTDIWQRSILGIKKNKKILSGESTGEFEEFHYLRNNLAWLPDGKHYALVSKTSSGDKIYIIDLETQKAVQEFSFPGFDAIFEIDFSNDGNKIVFTGQQNLKSDIYIFDINTKEITAVTDDQYFDSQPHWSPDDKKIVFTSERTLNEKGDPDQIFSKLTSDIYYFELTENKFFQITGDQRENSFPIWDKTGDKVIFVSENDTNSNLNIIDITNGERAKITNVHGGIFSPDISVENDELIFSAFYNSGWDIYSISNPLQQLEYTNYSTPVEFEFTNDFFTKFEIERYKLFGKQKKKYKKELPEYSKKISKVDLGKFSHRDSLNKEYNKNLDRKPTEIHEPLSSRYKPKFALDYLWGGAAYSPSIGTYATLQFGLSDLMGNHAIGVQLGITGDLSASDFVFTYMNLKNRIDHGYGGFYLSDEWIYWTNFYGRDDFLREREYNFGIYSILRYPFNKFWRIDFENIFSNKILKRDWWDGRNWLEEYLPPDFAENYNLEVEEKEYIYAPQITLIHDNAIYGSVGPISGSRKALLVNHSFSTDKDYTIIYADLRKYIFFAKKYAFAFRLSGGTIRGDTKQKFIMDYYNGVRGLDEDYKGKNKILASAELRYPFIDNLKLSFPLPLYLYQIRGSAFIDAGSVWDENSEFKFSNKGKLEDVKLSLGFGPRLNLGYFVLKFDVAWNTDLERFSKPVYYISLTPDF